MKNSQKKILLMTITFIAAIAICGASAAAPANYDVSITYYQAGTETGQIAQTTAAQQAFIDGSLTATPITSANAGDNIVKVIRLKNTGGGSQGVEITDKIDTTYQTGTTGTANDYVSYATPNGGAVPLPKTGVNVYNPTTGVWNVGQGNYPANFVGSPYDAVWPDWYDNYLFVYTTVKVAGLLETKTITNTADITSSWAAGTINNNAAPVSALHTVKTLTVEPVTDVTVSKQYWTPATAADPAVNITNGEVKYNAPIWMYIYVTNLGPSSAFNSKVLDTLPTGLSLDTTRSTWVYDQELNKFYENPTTVTWNGNTLQWNVGTVNANHFFLLEVPVITTKSGVTLSNTAVESQTTKNKHDGAVKVGDTWTINSNTAKLTIPKAANLTINKAFVNKNGVPQTSTWYNAKDNDQLYALISVNNSGPDAANWVVAEDLINPLLWTIDFANIETSYDGGLTWSKNDSNVYMLGNYLSWVVSPRKVTQTELAILMLGIPLPNMPAPALLAPGTTALLKMPINAAVTGTPAILGTNAAAIVWNDEKYSMNVGLPAQKLALAEIAIQRSADLSIVKSVSDNTPDSGDVITFTLTATSAEDVNWVGNLVKAKVTDIINPNYFKLINVTFKNVTNPATPYVNSYTYDAATGKLVWTIGNLDDGAWIQALVTVQVLKNAATAAVDNTATIEGWWQSTLPISNYAIHDLDPSNDSSTVTVNVNGTTIPPLTVVSTTPSNNSDYYGLTKPVYITFSNAVSLTGAGTVLIKNLTSGSNISTPVVTVSGSQLKIQFAKSRLKNNVYQITIPAGLVVDQYGQKNAAFTLTFTARQ